MAVWIQGNKTDAGSVMEGMHATEDGGGKQAEDGETGDGETGDG